MPPTSAVIFLGAIYYGAMYGGAISSVMLGIPGASTAVATTFDGRPLALRGLADKALVAAAAASFVGGTISVLLFTGFAPPLAQVALAWVLGQPGITSAILGASRAEQLDDTLPAVALKLSAEELAFCNQIANG